MSALILVASVLGLAFGVIYTLFRPQWAILFVLILYPLEQLLTTASPFFATNTKFLNLLVGGLAVLGAGSALFAGRRPFRGYFNGVWFATIALFLWAMIGIAFAPDTTPGTEALIKGLPYLGLLLIFPGLLLNDLIGFRRLVVPVMFIGTIIILLILASPKTTMFGGRLGIENTTGGRDSAEILNPLATASLGGTIVIFGMLYKPERMVLFVNLIRAAAITVGLTIALLSGSRGQLIGAIFCGVVMFPFARQIKNTVQFLTVSGSVGVVIVFVMLVLTFATTRDAATRFSSEALTEGAGVRGQLITTMLGHWLGNPVAIVQGLGTSAFQYYWQLDDTPYVHNMPVQVITEQGLIGLFLLSVILYLTARAGIQLLRMYKDYPTELSAAAILVGFCLYQFLISLKQGNYFTIAAPFWSFLLLAKVHARAIKDAREYEALEEYAESYDHPADDAVYAQPA